MANLSEQLSVDLATLRAQLVESSNRIRSQGSRLAEVRRRLNESENRVQRIQLSVQTLRARLRTVSQSLLQTGVILGASTALSGLTSDSPLISALSSGLSTVAVGFATGGAAGATLAGISAAVTITLQLIRNVINKQNQLERALATEKRKREAFEVKVRNDLISQERSFQFRLDKLFATIGEDVNELLHQAGRVVTARG